MHTLYPGRFSRRKFLRGITLAGTADIEPALASGEADLNGHFAAPLLLRLQAGIPSSSWRDSTSAVLSCSVPIASSRSATSRGRPWLCRR